VPTSIMIKGRLRRVQFRVKGGLARHGSGGTEEREGERKDLGFATRSPFYTLSEAAKRRLREAPNVNMDRWPIS
jgi:hypothetical protein